MHVRLVPGVEDDRVGRGVEDAVEGDRQFDHTQVGAEVTAGAGDVLDEERADLGGELPQLIGGQTVEVTGTVDAG